MEITFKDIVKLIHPDTNPNIQDASGKMTLVLKYKHNSLTLWNLAVRWGLVQGSYNVTSPESPNDTPVPNRKGWGYDRTNPEWTPTGTGWSTAGTRQTPRRPTRTPKDMSIHDYVLFAVDGEIKHGVIMSIRENGSKFDVDIVSNFVIITKTVTTLVTSSILKKVKKATKSQIQSCSMIYDMLRRK